MAYALRYYYESELKDGKVIRLEIHEKDGTQEAMPIGDIVQAIELEIIGTEADIVAPITTTALHLTFVDAPDLPQAATHKCGDWVEFYTPDSTYWKVLLFSKEAGSADFVQIWGGYVTPDSYEEVLSYHGNVSITARDNIGHLNDFDYDYEGNADGMVSLALLLDIAWEKIESPMQLVWQDESQFLHTGGVPAYNTYMNAAAFEDGSWYDAIEKALDSYGLAMRYVGGNKVVICPLRFLPYLGDSDAANALHIAPIFVTGATRMLSPAVRRIEEVDNYDIQESIEQPLVLDTDFTGEQNTYTCEISGLEIDGVSFGTLAHPAPAWPIRNTTADGWGNMTDTTLFFDASQYEAGYFAEHQGYADSFFRGMYIAANNTDSRYVGFTKTTRCTDFKFHITLDSPVSLNVSNELMKESVFNLNALYYTLELYQNGVTTYYQGNGSWRATKKQLVQEFDPSQETTDVFIEVYAGSNTGDGEFTLTINKIEYLQTGYRRGDTGLYAHILSLAIESSDRDSFLEKNKITTIYNENNNLIISREPALAPAFDSPALPAFIKNGIFVKNGNRYDAAKEWRWVDYSGKAMQMAALNHFQILCYYYKPNNVLEGTAVNGDMSRMFTIWDWGGSEHLMVGGRFDFLSGNIESAILREFKRYESQVFVRLVNYFFLAPMNGIVLDVEIICWDIVAWEVTELPNWIAASKTSGQGPETIQMTVAPNGAGKVRTAVIHIENARLTITQRDKLGDFSVDFSFDYY